MIVRRASVGLSLLSALLFCAIAAPGASAAAHTSENTTAFTCVPSGGGRDFKDAHCDETTSAGTGSFGHELIPAGATQIELSNEKTANKTTEAAVSTIKSKVPGGETHIDCKTFSGTGTIENGGTGTDHKVTGAGTLAFSNCEVTKPLNCKVKEPITIKAISMGVDELNGAEKNMGMELVSEGANFGEVTYEGASCALKGKTFPLTGSAIGTGATGGNAKEAGATIVFENTKEMQSVKFGAEPAEFSAIGTMRMKVGGNPITLTTTT